MNHSKLKAGNTVTWRSIEWKVLASDRDTYELRPKKPEIAAIVGPIRFKKEIELPSQPVIKESINDLSIPSSLDPKDWDPEYLRWKFLINSRFQSTSANKLLWGTAVPIQQLNRQLLPTYHGIQQKYPRILIADDVGLGKTTEAGLLISELLARKWAERVLVIAPAHLAQRKWQTELNQRFGLCFSRVDSSNLLNIHDNRLLSADENPFQHTERLILSLDYAKEPHIRRKLEEAEWDLVVFDECHRIANRASHESSKRLRYLLADKLASRTRGLILISGTPHDGADDSFESLVELLSRKSEKVPKPPRPVIIRRLRMELSKDEALLAPEPQFAVYEPSKEWIRTAELLSNLIVAMKKEKVPGADLFQVLVFKRFISAPESLLKTLGFSNESEENEQKDIKTRLIVQAAQEKPVLKNYINELKKVVELLINKDPKKAWLTAHIAQIPKDDRLLIFTEFEDTATAIETVVKATGRKVFVVSGSDHKQINEKLTAFKSKKGSVLITTDTLSEGVDLQENCHRLLHYDLPFRPYRIEQRNGRIDRMGQKSKPQITMVVPVEERLETIGNSVATKALSISRLYKHLSRQKERLGSIVPVLESIKSLQGKSEVSFFLNLADIEEEVTNFKDPAFKTQAIEELTVGTQVYCLDRRSSSPELKWSAQTDLGLHPNLIRKTPALLKVLEKYLSEGLGESAVISESGELSSNATKELLQDLYPIFNKESASNIEKMNLFPAKDCVGEDNSECLTWGHLVWGTLNLANDYNGSTKDNVALSSVQSENPVAIGCWNTNQGIIISAAELRNNRWNPLADEVAESILSEELAAVDLRKNRVTPKRIHEDHIKAVFDSLSEKALKRDESAEFLGLILRPEGGQR
ncbi:MAG: hypothetical protein EBQ92_08985 [Proteobacteria bacterium]|nr:hypothetical protein [Pseudomonadota bacterium]